ncbi:hypothetical protein PR001_g23288 [Phytophthora rubi]|uniref:Uncharacterized protein n=1 Tax=Phytophthora rubi TaxID=129364 RepID=A0A6A3IQH6_9STRA|nr:hypothetical protein PR002_g23688 [Phytophthora rubi]KAE8984022.1 hypothetical protein PR001_g23288 [Phytophthora rubi]
MRAPLSRPAKETGKERARAAPAAKKPSKKKSSPAVAGQSRSSIEQPRATSPPAYKAPISRELLCPRRTSLFGIASTQRSSPPILYIDSASESDSGDEATLPAPRFPVAWTQSLGTDPSSTHASTAPSSSEEPLAPMQAQPPVDRAAPPAGTAVTLHPAFNLTDFLSQFHSGPHVFRSHRRHRVPRRPSGRMPAVPSAA